MVEYPQSLGTIVDLPKSSKPALQPGKPHPPLGLLLDDLAGLRMATPMHPDRSFYAPAVLTGAPVRDEARDGAQKPSRLYAHRDPLCLTLRLLTATRVSPHGYPTNS